MKYGSTLPTDFQLPGAFWLKKDLTEEHNPFNLMPVPVGMTVMDCGGFLGTFSAACLEQGAARVVTYECMPKTLVPLRANLAKYGDRSEVVAAAVSNTKGVITLFTSGFSGAHSITKAKGASGELEVATVRFIDEVVRVKPDVLKVDVEGAEYLFILSLTPDILTNMQSVFVEFHPHPERSDYMKAFAELAESAGLAVVNYSARRFTVVNKAWLRTA